MHSASLPVGCLSVLVDTVASQAREDSVSRNNRKAEPAQTSIQVYDSEGLTASRLDKQRVLHERFLRGLGVGRGLSTSAFALAILEKALAAKAVYDKHNDGGWPGYWAAVEAAVAKNKKKGRRS